MFSCGRARNVAGQLASCAGLAATMGAQHVNNALKHRHWQRHRRMGEMMVVRVRQLVLEWVNSQQRM
jgi:hypothetical protein